MGEMRRVLTPGGQIGLLDWRPDAANENGPPRHHRLAAEKIRHALLEAGFELLPIPWDDQDAYLIRARLL